VKKDFTPVDISEQNTRTNDNGGTRSVEDRRQFKIIDYKPERRSGKERRSGVDRRKGQNFRGEKAIERRESFR
jgi:hypothetical protein